MVTTPKNVWRCARRADALWGRAGYEKVRELLKSVGCIESISTDEAIELLERYEIINPYASKRTWSWEFLYNYKLYKDGRKKLSDYNYVRAIYEAWDGSSRYLPLECLAAFISAGSGLYGSELSSACKYGHTEIVRLLLDVPGIDVNARDGSGLTALYAAARNGKPEIVKLLLAVPGIELEKKCNGSTPLENAKRNGYNREIINLLKSAGAKE